jgi:hypothetical protein
MTLDAKNFAGRQRNPGWERKLAHDLRLLPEAERLQFVKEFLDIHLLVALDLGRKCLSNRKSLESLLELGLQQADPSVIQDWLKCVLPGLGARRLVQCLSRHLKQYPQAVESALYWLPGLLTKSDLSKIDLTRLRQIA